MPVRNVGLKENPRRRLGTANRSRARSRPYPTASRPRFLTLAEGGASVAVMVGALRGPEHLEVIRRWRYYHVPVSAVAKGRTAVQIIAFYEPAARFNRSQGQIREYAPVLRVTETARKDLPGLTWPGRGGEDAPYYRFDLGPIRSLLSPVTNPDGLRVAFRFVDLDSLRTARTIRDLGWSGRGPRPPA